MGLRSLKEQIDLALKARRAWNQLEDDMESKEFDWLIAIKKGLISTFNHAFYPALFLFLAMLSDEKALTRFLTDANVNTAYLGVIVLAVRFFVRVAGNALKNHPDFRSSGPDLKSGALAGALLALLCSPAIAQDATPSPTPSSDAMSWLSSHSAIVSGTYSTDASDREEFIGVRIAGDFDIAPKIVGWAQVDLFTRSRDGQSATPALPSSPAGLAVYSSGEVRIGAYRTLSGLLSAECIAGATFAMPTLAGPSVDPLDGTKILGGCGLRVGTRTTYVRAIGGHFGPVVDGGVLAGFVPSLTLGGRVPIRDHIALTPEVSIGRNTLAQRTTYAVRIAFVAF